MRFKLKKQERNSHHDIVSAVTWSSNNELFRYFAIAKHLSLTLSSSLSLQCFR